MFDNLKDIQYWLQIIIQKTFSKQMFFNKTNGPVMSLCTKWLDLRVIERQL